LALGGLENGAICGSKVFHFEQLELSEYIQRQFCLSQKLALEDVHCGSIIATRGNMLSCKLWPEPVKGPQKYRPSGLAIIGCLAAKIILFFYDKGWT